MITVFTRSSLVDVTPDQLAAGIAERLGLFTALYCPIDEEKPDVVLARLRVVPTTESVGFDTWHVRYGRAHNAAIAVVRTAREASATPFQSSGVENVAYMARIHRGVEPRDLREVADVLDRAYDVVSIRMTKKAAQRMAWPVGVAAAAWLAARGDGILFVPGSGWLVPTKKEARPAR